MRAVEQLRLDDADGLPREVVRHVPDEREDEDEDAVSAGIEAGSHDSHPLAVMAESTYYSRSV